KAIQNARSLGKDLFAEMGPDGEDGLTTFLQNKLKGQAPRRPPGPETGVRRRTGPRHSTGERAPWPGRSAASGPISTGASARRDASRSCTTAPAPPASLPPAPTPCAVPSGRP